MSEPAIHSQIEDLLPDTHPLAYETVWCAKCGTMLHANNNECMTTWVESGRGCFCLQCFNFLVIHENGVLGEDWALPESGAVSVIDCEHVWFDASNEHVYSTAMCARCGALELLNNVELSEDVELVKACLQAREAGA